MTSFQKFAQGYRNFALWFLNSVLMCSIAAGVYFLVKRARESKQADDPIKRYGVAQLLPGYPGRSAAEIAVLMKETYDRPLIYEPFTHFRELPSTGQFVNVTQAGYRLIEDQGPWPLDPQNFNVFVFGGSTTFGAGVADRETIPSALQKQLRAICSKPVCVYNFGRGFYYSSQERILFSNFLAAGIVPDIAVFIDGLNDFYRQSDAPQFSGQFMGLINQSLHERKGIHAPAISELVPKHSTSEKGTTDERARRICERYLRNKAIIGGMAKAYSIKSVFVWQPVPTYKFDLKLHPFSQSSTFGEHFFPESVTASWHRSGGQTRKRLKCCGLLICRKMLESSYTWMLCITRRRCAVRLRRKLHASCASNRCSHCDSWPLTPMLAHCLPSLFGSSGQLRAHFRAGQLAQRVLADPSARRFL